MFSILKRGKERVEIEYRFLLKLLVDYLILVIFLFNLLENKLFCWYNKCNNIV